MKRTAQKRTRQSAPAGLGNTLRLPARGSAPASGWQPSDELHEEGERPMPRNDWDERIERQEAAAWHKIVNGEIPNHELISLPKR